MARIEVSETLSGGDDEVVVTLKSVPAELRFGTPAAVVWNAQNRGTDALVFPALDVTLGGAGKDKVSASLLATALTIPAGETKEVSVTLEPSSPIFPRDSVTVTLSGDSDE